jgi:hypothetical protein
LGNIVLGSDRVALSGRPRQVVTTDLNVIVCEFTKLVIVHTEELSFFGGAKVEARDLVDDESDDGADDEGVGGAGDNVGNLDVHLLPVVHDPATFNRVDTVETDDVGCGKDTVEDETDHSGDTVLSEHIKGIIDLDPEFDCELLVAVISCGGEHTLGCKVSNNASGDAESNARPWCDESGSWGGSNESRNAS